MSLELPPKKSFFFNDPKPQDKTISKVISDYMLNPNHSNFMSRRASRTYDILMDKENVVPHRQEQIQKVDQFSETISSLSKVYRKTISEYNQAYEQGQMLMEDLNGKLMERAELIGQREELDLLIDQQIETNNTEYEYVVAMEELQSRESKSAYRINEIKKQIECLTAQRSLLQQQMKNNNSEHLSLMYVDKTNHIQREQSKLAQEIKSLNSINHEQDQVKHSLKNKIQDSIKQAFQEYLLNQQITFKKLKEQYGTDLFNTIIVEHKQQLESLLNSQIHKKIMQIQQLRAQYNKLQQQISRNMNYVDNFLTIDIQQVQQTIELKKDVMFQLQRQLSHQSVPTNDYDQLKKKVEFLEIEKLQLEQQVIEMTLQMETHSKRYLSASQQGMNTVEKLYGEILGSSINENSKSPLPKSFHSNSSSKKKKRSYSEINQQKQFYKTQRQLDKTSDSSAQNDSLGLSLIHDISNLRASDSLDKACQLSADDSLLAHIQDLNSTINQKCTNAQLNFKENIKKSMNMPLQRPMKQAPIVPHDDEDANVRLQTITEEQLSTNRQEEESRFKFRQAEIKIDDNCTTKKNPLLGLTTSQPTTNKAKKTYSFLRKESLQHSENSRNSSSASRSLDNTLQYRSTSNYHHQQPQPLLPIEQDVLRMIQPLLDGIEVFKKFSNQTQLKKDDYNPFSQVNPQQLGYGPRFMYLSKSMNTLEFRNPMRPQMLDSQIKIDQILRPSLPPITQQIVQMKKKPCNLLLQLSLIVQGQGRISLLIPGEENIQLWVQGLQFVKDNQRIILSIKKKLNL